MCVSYSTATQVGTATFSVASAPWDYSERRFDAEEKPFVVLIEDNIGDVLLVEEVIREHQVDCNLTGDANFGIVVKTLAEFLKMLRENL